MVNALKNTCINRLVYRALLMLSLSLLFSFSVKAQPTISASFEPATIGPGSNARLIYSLTNGSGFPVVGMAFTNALPTVPGDVDISTSANIETNCLMGIGGAITAPNGGNTIIASDLELGAGQSCQVSVNVTASTPGSHTNPAITLASSAGSSMSLPIDLTVATNLSGFSKSFTPSAIKLGAPSRLTFTFDNTLNTNRVGNLNFTDYLPVGLVIASPANSSTDCISASAPNTTLTAISGTNQITLVARGNTIFPGFEVLPIGASCTATVDVVATGIGVLINQSENLKVDFIDSGFAVAPLDVTSDKVVFYKEFLDDPVPPGGLATLRFTMLNTDRNFPATSVAFTDNLAAMTPVLAGLIFDSLVSNDCAGNVTGVGSTLIGFSGGTIPAQASCSIEVSLTIPAAANQGQFINTTSQLTSTIDGSGFMSSPAVAYLFVESIPTLTMEFLEVGTFATDPIVNSGDDVIIRYTVTNTSATSAATDITFLDELTDGGVNTGFFPFPLSMVFPPTACGGTVALSFFDTDRQGLSLTSGNLTAAPAAGSSCTFDVTVTIPSDMPVGNYQSTTGEITAAVDGATRIGNPASDSLTIVAAPSLTKSFINNTVAGGDTVTLEFTLAHGENALTDATGITFTDDLSTVLGGLVAISPSAPNPPCGAGSSLVGSAGDTFLTLMGGTLSPGSSCTFSVDLSVPLGAAIGTYINTTSGVSALVQGVTTTSNPASDDLSIAGLVFTKAYVDNPVIPGQATTLRFALDNIHPILDTTITSFTDNLTASLTGLMAIGLPTTDTCGGTLAGTTLLTYSGGSLPAGTSCIIDVPILVPAAAATNEYVNVTSSLSVTQGAPVTIPPATDSLSVSSNLLSLSQSFTDDPVVPGDTVTLEFTLENLDLSNAASSISFTDDLDAALTGLSAVGLPLNNVCGAGSTITGTSSLSFSDGNLPAGGTCTFSLTLQVPFGVTSSVNTNTTSDVTGTINGLAVDGDSASDDLGVRLLTFSKSFNGPTTATGTPVLTFTIENVDATNAASDLAFSDDLNLVLSGLVATNLPLTDVCGTGSLLSGSSFLLFTGGNIPASGSCTFDVNLSVPLSAMAGNFPNTTSSLLSAGLIVADPAVADLVIEAPPVFSKSFSPNAIGQGMTSNLTFTIDNSTNTIAASNLMMTDNLPAGIVVDAAPMINNTCGGIITAMAGTAVVSLNNGTLAAGSSCVIEVSVTGVSSGTHVNITSDLISSSGNSGSATATLSVNSQPGFDKIFTPSTVFIGSVSTLDLTIDNSLSTVDAMSLAFVDTFPTNMTIATPSNANTSCTGGTLTAVSGSNSISYSSGAVNAGATCVISVDVITSNAGTFVNTSGNLTSDLGMSPVAVDTLIVDPVPLFSMQYMPDTIHSGGISQLVFTIDNSFSSQNATALDFTDNLPVGLLVSTPANSTSSCIGGTITAVSGTSIISYNSGTVNSANSCTISVDVTSSVLGNSTNNTGDLTSNHGNSGQAMASLLVANAPMFSKSFSSDPILIDDIIQLTFTIDNTNNLADVGLLSFDDVMPLGFQVASPNTILNTCTGGTVTAVPGSNTISYSAGQVSAMSVCDISVDVSGTIVGDYINTTSNLDSDLGMGSTASATITVVDIPVLTKVFSSTNIVAGNAVELTFEITNNSSILASQISFTDDLDAFVTGAVAVNTPQNDVCGIGSSLTGTSLVSLNNGNLLPNSSCQFSIMVSIPLNALGGEFVNITSPLSVEYNGSVFTGSAGSGASDALIISSIAINIPLLNTWIELLMLTLGVFYIFSRRKKFIN